MFGHAFLRSILLSTLLLTTSVLSARVTWILGEGAPVGATAVADQLAAMLGEEVEVVATNTTYLSAWANNPETEEARVRQLAADHLLITPSSTESLELATLALTAIRDQRALHLSRPILVATQKPVYRMRGLTDNKTLQRTARVALGSDLDFIALPKVWQQVYTDDTFYNGRVPKGPVSEAYIIAAALAFKVRGEEFACPRLPGVHPDIADELIESVKEGLTLTDDVLYAARHLARSSYDIRLGNTFEAVLFDGAFEHAIGDWLTRFAQADGRTLTLHYTTDTELNTGLPCLFRTVNPLGKAPNASLYTRPAFKDDSGITELTHLNAILKADAAKQNWLPFPLAVAEWTRRLSGKPIYNGTTPTPAAAAMFAAMIYLDWTGSAVLPQGIDQEETVAIGIGLETMLKMRLQRAEVNAIFCRPIDAKTYAFSLWQQPKDKVTLSISSDNKDVRVSPRKLTFTPETYWSRQTVTVEAPCKLLWKIPAQDFPGQNNGVRIVE